MGMNVGAGGGRHVAPVMNVTPLVDIVLVLLIIFIVITPQLTRKFWVHTPKQEKKETEQAEDPNPPLVLRVGADRSVTVNGTQLTMAELAGRLRRMFAARSDHVIFFDADDEAEYGFAVQVMDQARAGGAVTIAPLIKKLGDSAAAPAG